MTGTGGSCGTCPLSFLSTGHTLAHMDQKGTTWPRGPIVSGGCVDLYIAKLLRRRHSAAPPSFSGLLGNANRANCELDILSAFDVHLLLRSNSSISLPKC